MLKTVIHNVPFYRFSGLGSYYRIEHFISTRKGGVSGGGQASLNMGFMEADAPGNVLANRRLLLSEMDIPLESVVFGEQRHTTNVAVVGKEEAGRGAKEKSSRLPETDALITAVPGICLVVLAADCVPILLYDTECHVVAAVHAGWRGTVGQIARKVVERMVGEFGCRPRDIRAGIGPAIGPCCYEVGKEVWEKVRTVSEDLAGVVTSGRGKGKYFLDLWEANRRQLLDVGLYSGQIEVAGVCTACHHDEFYSYRASGGDTGRFAVGIMLRTEQR